MSDILKLDVALHVFFGAFLGAWFAPDPFVGKVAVCTLIYLGGEAREHLELIGDFGLTGSPGRDNGMGPTWHTWGQSFGRKHRIEALAWLVGSIIGAAIAAVL